MDRRKSGKGLVQQGTSTFTVVDAAGNALTLLAVAEIGTRRVKFHDFNRITGTPCVVADLAKSATEVALAGSGDYEARLAPLALFLAGYALGMYQAYEPLTP
ncbi:hypothetical protein [Glycomyces buryatensis]|uniref:Uncharacterized protein n=1 Tax=Glycomyces buryatensis TaxID=2570927 RepID=A0A4S8PVZ4_9ACTN|nr:hypothetical protein [Glycomyces buryatensis]THV35698.1 hypothetical protein FAB82_22750 [Glycomyces buryatensis]